MANPKKEQLHNFDILFEKLDSSIKEQRQFLDMNPETDPDLIDTIALFREYQQAIGESSFTTLTRGWPGSNTISV